MNKTFGRFGYPYLVWMAIFILIPVLLIFFYSITTTNNSDLSTAVFSFEHFNRVFESNMLTVFYNSFKLAILTTGIALIIGYPIAYILSNMSIRSRSILLVLFIIPMWINMLLRTYAWKSILAKNGMLNQLLELFGLNSVNLLNTEAAVLIGMAYNFLPFMIFPIYTALEKMDKSLIEAAWDLGASRMKTFFKVVLPLSMPGVISGVIMVFMPAASSFVIPTYLGGGKVDLIGNVIERQFMTSGNWNFGSALSIILMIVILFTIWIMNKFGDKDGEVGLW